jgi:hypothetical protein
VDPDDFEEALAASFDAAAGERRVVARMAADLAVTGRYREVAEHDLTPEVVAENLRDAPDDGLASKWNWWLGALELAFGRRDPTGGFAEFQVRRYETDAGAATTGDEDGSPDGE